MVCLWSHDRPPRAPSVFTYLSDYTSAIGPRGARGTMGGKERGWRVRGMEILINCDQLEGTHGQRFVQAPPEDHGTSINSADSGVFS